MEIYVDMFFILITIIFNNLIAGIIIDSFADQRGNDDSMVEDMENICYICGHDKATIDRTNSPFAKHIAVEHD